MVIKVILGVLVLLYSCSNLALETGKAGPCSFTDREINGFGTLRVKCEDLEFVIRYDNIPDGRDPFILEVSGLEVRRSSLKKHDPYRMMSADEELEGFAVEELWEGKGVKLYAFEFFADGGRYCYDWEEGYRLELELRGRKLTLLDRNWEGTECNGN
jgi:hypothetical protein